MRERAEAGSGRGREKATRERLHKKTVHRRDLRFNQISVRPGIPPQHFTLNGDRLDIANST